MSRPHRAGVLQCLTLSKAVAKMVAELVEPPAKSLTCVMLALEVM